MKDESDSRQDGNAAERERGSGRRSGGPVREMARRLITTGAEAVAQTEKELRNLVGEVNAREAVSGIIDTVSKGTDTIQSIFVREARRYLDAINVQDELGRLLSDYSIEVNARINFIPRDKSKDKKRRRKGDPNAAQLETDQFLFKLIPKEDASDANSKNNEPTKG